MKDRLMKIITSEGLTPSILADELGVQRSGISHILSGRNYPSFDFLQKLLSHFPKLNAEWVLLGQGQIYKSTSPNNPDLFSSLSIFEKLPETIATSAPSPNSPFVQGDKINPTDQTSDISSSEGIKKTIEKIVTFYTDRTFTVYLPE